MLFQNRRPLLKGVHTLPEINQHKQNYLKTMHFTIQTTIVDLKKNILLKNVCANISSDIKLLCSSIS